MGKSRGFTLIELVVVMSIFGILAMMAAPSMSTLLEKIRLERNTRELLLLLSQAKSQAILNRTNVSANLASNSANTATTLNWTVMNSDTTLSITPTVSASTFTFDTNGLVSNITADTTINLCNSKAKLKKTIVLIRLGTYIIKPDTTVSTC